LRRMLLIDAEKCTGCRLCELVCSFRHYKAFNPKRSRITVIRDEEKGVFIPMTCLQCEDPPCMKTCPTHAIYRDENGAIRIDYDKCIGCKLCIMYCPFGGISIDPATMKVIKCDLCGGDPECVKYCPKGAIQYVRVDEVGVKKRIEGAKKIHERIKVIVGGES